MAPTNKPELWSSILKSIIEVDGLQCRVFEIIVSIFCGTTIVAFTKSRCDGITIERNFQLHYIKPRRDDFSPISPLRGFA
jgi:hypothetical protein